MNLKEIVGMNLKYYRYKTGLSQEKFYSSLELNPKYLACIERDEVNLTIENIEHLAKTMGINVNDLIFYKESHIINKKRIDEKTKVNT